jgi:hypothetical protein
LRLDSLAERGDSFEFVGADYRIHLGHILLNIAAMALHQTSGDDQLLRAAGLLVFCHFKDGIDRFLLGGVDEATGVYYDHVGVGGVRRQLMAGTGELAHHHLCIH